MNNRLYSHFSAFLALFFPKECAGCGHILVSQENLLCSVCRFHLPLTNFHLDPQNQVARQLWGKFPFVDAAAMLLLQKESAVERIIYLIKYGNQPKLAYHFGFEYGKALRTSPLFQAVDLLIPVPLHVKKLKKRGYNQSLYLARGIAEALDKPVFEAGLLRVEQRVSQTKKSRLERYDNVENVFRCPAADFLQGKHVLLVDDVLTTGATLTAAAEELIAAGCQISIVTLARASS